MARQKNEIAERRAWRHRKPSADKATKYRDGRPFTPYNPKMAQRRLDRVMQYVDLAQEEIKNHEYDEAAYSLSLARRIAQGEPVYVRGQELKV